MTKAYYFSSLNGRLEDSNKKIKKWTDSKEKCVKVIATGYTKLIVC
jgi:hypothetical protein